MDKRPPNASSFVDSRKPMTTEEFFRDVVFGAENRRERRREQNTAPMTSPDYWRQEFDETQGKVAPHIEMPKQTSHSTTERPPRPGFPMDPAQPKAPGRLTTFPESNTILGSGLDSLSTVPQRKAPQAPHPASAQPGPPPLAPMAANGVLRAQAQAPAQSHDATLSKPARDAETGGSPATTKPPGTGAPESLETLFEKYSPVTRDKKTGDLQANVKSPVWSLSPATAGAQVTLEALRNRKLDGSALDAGTLLGHYTHGDGSPREMDFTKVDTTGVTPEQFPGFKEKIKELQAAGGGKAKINLEQTYRTKGMQRGALGHISMTLSGTLTVDDKGWSLDGGLGAKDDNYDFDPKEWGERSIEGEISTRIGSKLKGKPFDIHFNGSKPLHVSKPWE